MTLAKIPKCVARLPLVGEQPLAEFMTALGYTQDRRGKVRDTYHIFPEDPNHLIVVATDRLSIYDFVLPVIVPDKGDTLTALTDFWLKTVLSDIDHHLVDFPEDTKLPRQRCLRVRKLDIQPYELIFRGHIGGSVWKEYQANGTAGGIVLPKGLVRWQKLDQPIFTPSTKAEDGHDINITAAKYLEQMGDIGARTVEIATNVYRRAYEFAKNRGVLILDTKVEFGTPPILADEVLTPDSSRFTTVEDYNAAMAEGRNPAFLDKEPVREWGQQVETPFGTGINKLDPENPEHLDFVHNKLTVPDEVIVKTTERYHHIFTMLTGMSLTEYQRDVMGITAE